MGTKTKMQFIGFWRLSKPVVAIALALQLGACASLGDEAFTLAGADTGAPEEVAAVEASGTASAPADLGGDDADVTVRHPNAVFAVAEDDPFEHFNRSMFHINDSIDTHFIVPIAQTYRVIVPDHARESISNAFSNLAAPVTWANDVVQGEWERAHVTFSRFVINSTVGIAGLHDIAATEYGIQAHYEDFDQTMALHGIGSGPYLVLPLLGPATPRHVVGRVVDSFAHPLTWALANEPILVRAAPRAGEAVSVREELLDPTSALRENSPDYYAAVRSLYRQNRASEIGNGQGQGQSEDDQTSLDDDLDLNFD